MSLQPTIIKTLLNGPLSMADLQAAVSVSLPTLRKALQDLAENRWVRVVGQAEANGGRPAMLYGLDATYYLIVGVHLQLPGVRLIAVDLQGEVVAVAESDADSVPTPESVVQRISDVIQRLRRRYPERRLLGVGLASPGFTDPATRDILSIERVPGWRNFPICERLTRLHDLPVTLANDVDCMAFAEFQQTGTSFEQNLAYVGFEEGVKVSMVLNGQLYKGSLGNAGLVITELLHLNGVHGATLSAAEQRAVLTIHGLNRLFDDRLAALPAGARAAYRDILEAGNQRQRFQRILEGAAGGLVACRDVTQTLTDILAVAIANLVYIIQPDQVVIGGALSRMPAPIYADLERAIRALLPTLLNNRLTMQRATLASPDRAALGASYHLLESVLGGW